MFVVWYDFAVDLLALEVFLGLGFQIFGMRRVVADEGRLLLIVTVRILDELDERRAVRVVDADAGAALVSSRCRGRRGRRRRHRHVIAI